MEGALFVKMTAQPEVGEALSLPQRNGMERPVEWYAIRPLGRGRVSRPDSATETGAKRLPYGRIGTWYEFADPICRCWAMPRGRLSLPYSERGCDRNMVPFSQRVQNTI